MAIQDLMNTARSVHISGTYSEVLNEVVTVLCWANSDAHAGTGSILSRCCILCCAPGLIEKGSSRPFQPLEGVLDVQYPG